MPLSKRLRYEVLRRDNHACRYCGAAAPEAKLTVDHVVPVALGGTDEPPNLVTACEPCNSGKSATQPGAPVVSDVAADALRWSRAMAQAHKVARANYEARLKRRVTFHDEIWGEWSYEYPRGKRNTFDLPVAWEDTIDRFCEFGITDEEFSEAVNIAMTRRNKDPFRYMCAIIWRWIGERQEIALEIVRGEQADNGP